MTPSLPSIAELRRRFHTGETNPSEFLKSLEAAITAHDSELAAYLSYSPGTARAAAELADTDLPLGGLPIAVQDNINVLDEPCTCGSRLLGSGHIAAYDATVVRRLREAGAIPYGRTNLEEFAFGAAGEHFSFKATRNPAAPAHAPGGAAAGAAAAVAAGTALAVIASDDDGSARLPASYCGVSALKPSAGRVPLHGVVSASPSLAQIGILAHHVADIAALLQVLAGPDPADSCTRPDPVPDYLEELHRGVAGLKIGLPRECLDDMVDPEVKARTLNAAELLQSAGAKIVEIPLPHLRHAPMVQLLLSAAEASSNLAAFDGIRYGVRKHSKDDLDSLYTVTRGEGFGFQAKLRVLLGVHLLSAGNVTALYEQAQRVRGLIRQDFDQAHAVVDVILTPTSPRVAPKLEGAPKSTLATQAERTFLLAANLTGACALSIPAGGRATPAGSQLPVGLQIMGPALAEAIILRVATTLEESYRNSEN